MTLQDFDVFHFGEPIENDLQYFIFPVADIFDLHLFLQPNAHRRFYALQERRSTAVFALFYIGDIFTDLPWIAVQYRPSSGMIRNGAFIHFLIKDQNPRRAWSA